MFACSFKLLKTAQNLSMSFFIKVSLEEYFQQCLVSSSSYSIYLVGIIT